MIKECENCIKRKTMWCPPSCECMALDELPYYLDKISALKKIDDLEQENKQLKSILTELEEWLKEDIQKCINQGLEISQEADELILNKIQELKEKYK